MKIVLENLTGAKRTSRTVFDVLDWLTPFLKQKGFEVIKKVGSDLDIIRYDNRDVRVYKWIFDYCEEVGADKLLLGGMTWSVSHLLNEIESRKNLKTKVIGIGPFREIERSLSRADAYSRFINLDNVDKFIFYSMIGAEMEPPENWKKVSPNKEKYAIFSDPINETNNTDIFKKTKEEGRKRFNFSNDKFIIGFFGSSKYVRGLDILIKAIPFLDKNIFIAISSTISEDAERLNIDWSFLNNGNVHFRNGSKEGYLSEEDMGLFFSAIDVMVLPFRKNYIYGSSGLPPQVSIAKKLMVLPDIYPYNYMADNYMLGEKFETENPKSLANAINSIYKNSDYYYSRARFNDYNKILSTLEDLAGLIAGKEDDLEKLIAERKLRRN